MGFVRGHVLSEWNKNRAVCLLLLGLINVKVNTANTGNEGNERSSFGISIPDKGKRNVLYNYITDRPRVQSTNFHQPAAGQRNNIATSMAQKQRLAQLAKYRQYLTKLYSKRRSDIDAPILQGDIPDYKDKQFENSPELVSDNELNDATDVNKKYAAKMVGLNYYTKDVLPASHVVLPHQDYRGSIGGNMDSVRSYSSYSPQESSLVSDGEDVSQPLLSNEEAQIERLVEMEKLRELEELRGESCWIFACEVKCINRLKFICR